MILTISGGGIGGLATALAIHSQSHLNVNINILEKNPTPDPFYGRGSGINLQPHAVKVLDDIGLMEEVLGGGWAPMNQQYYTRTGELISESPRGLFADDTGYPQISIHRAVLHNILESAVEERLGKDSIKRGLQGVSYTQDEDGVILKCEDQDGLLTEIKCDAVIGADGIHSRMRECILEKQGIKESGPVPSGINVYRGTAMVEKVLDGHTVVLAGRSDSKLVCYPIEAPKLVKENDEFVQKQLLNFVFEVREEDRPSKDTDLVQYVYDKMEVLNNGFSLPFLNHKKMLENADSIKGFPMSDKDPLNMWVDGRVVLLGDAAHPMYPVGSNGASTALLDVAELSFQLSARASDGGNLIDAFKKFEENRVPIASGIQLACRNMLPEQVMDKVDDNVPVGQPVPPNYAEELKAALAKCQVGKRSTNDDTKEKISAESVNTALTAARMLTNNELVSNYSPLERVLLNARGSLQATLSAMANTDVVVKPILTSKRNQHYLDREVHLHFDSQDGPCVVECKTTVIPKNENMKELMLSQSIGIGQLLAARRKEGKEEPNFKLISFGKKKDTILTRQYMLDIPGEVRFLINEDINLGALFGTIHRVDSQNQSSFRSTEFDGFSVENVTTIP